MFFLHVLHTMYEKKQNKRYIVFLKNEEKVYKPCIKTISVKERNYVMKNIKRIFSMLLACLMVFGVCPLGIFATGEAPDESPDTEPSEPKPYYLCIGRLGILLERRGLRTR